MNTNNFRRWFILAVISFSGGVSFDLAYLRYIYQIPMVQFMGFSNTEVGLIMSTFGIAAIVLYAPSGIIADKFSHRYMMTSAMILTGMLGFVMASYPPFWAMILIQIAFAVTTILMLWSVSIKAASLLGSADEQGAIMGWMEGFRGVGVMSLAVITMWVFSAIGPDNPASLRTVIMIYSVVYIILGVLCWFVVPDGRTSKQENQENKEKVSIKDILAVLKRKNTWYCSAIIFGVFTIYATLSYSTSYLTEHYGLSLITASYIGVLINKVFRSICGQVGGLITVYTRLKSPTKVIQYGSVLCALAIVAILFTNANPGSVILAVTLILVVTFVCMASRGLYWACIGESRTPKYIIGTTVGVCSVLGFLPDVFVYPLVGHWQDTLPPEQAYQNMWMMALAAMVLVFVATALLYREIRSNQPQAENSDGTPVTD